MKHSLCCIVRLAVFCVTAFASINPALATEVGPKAAEPSKEEYMPPIPEGKKWKLVWSDEFEGTKINESRWEILGDWKRRDGYWVKEDAYLDGKGNLILRTKKDGDRYTCGAVRTKKKFEHRFGYWVCRCQFPKQQGHWPAFWLHTDGVNKVGDEGRNGTEIDIMEKPWLEDKITQNLHWDGYGKDHKSAGKTTTIPGVSKGSHSFGLHWKPDEYVFYVDGKEIWRTSAGGVSQVPQFIKLTEEIGKWGGDIAKANLPDYFVVDYVRVYDETEKETGLREAGDFEDVRPKSYSELLREAVGEAGMYRSGYKLLIAAGRPESGWSPVSPPPIFIPLVNGWHEKEAVPYLLKVIREGPDWEYKKYVGRSALAPHIARCYAVLCLATSKDPNAFSVLSDLLQNGKYLKDFGVSEEEQQKYDIRVYAAAGLGILADANAVNSLVSTLCDKNPYVRLQSMFALAKIGDTRAIKPILEAAAEDTKLDDFSLHSCMQKMTKIRFDADFSRERGEITFKDFPELGPLKSPGYKKVWQHWLRVGGKYAQQEFEKLYPEWKKIKQAYPDVRPGIEAEMLKGGVAALPFIIEKVKAGDTALIPAISELTERKVKETATPEEVLTWWNNNKQRWLIPFED